MKKSRARAQETLAGIYCAFYTVCIRQASAQVNARYIYILHNWARATRLLLFFLTRHSRDIPTNERRVVSFETSASSLLFARAKVIYIPIARRKSNRAPRDYKKKKNKKTKKSDRERETMSVANEDDESSPAVFLEKTTTLSRPFSRRSSFQTIRATNEATPLSFSRKWLYTRGRLVFRIARETRILLVVSLQHCRWCEITRSQGAYNQGIAKY